MSAVELLFLGTGTSAGIPMIGCHCPVCSSPDPHDKRTRPSVVISSGGTTVLVDTTPELRMQCLANGIEALDAVVYTHGHADHVMGLDDLRRFNAISGKSLDVWADARTQVSLHRSFGYAFLGPPPPEQRVFRPNLKLRTIEGGFQIGSMHWQPVPLLHGHGSVLGFRMDRLAYCTDVSAIPEPSFALLEDLDVLVLGALSPNKHPSHFSLDEAVAASKKIGARQTLFTHIGHLLKHEETNRTLPDNIRLAYDGQHVSARSPEQAPEALLPNS